MAWPPLARKVPPSGFSGSLKRLKALSIRLFWACAEKQIKVNTIRNSFFIFVGLFSIPPQSYTFFRKLSLERDPFAPPGPDNPLFSYMILPSSYTKSAVLVHGDTISPLSYTKSAILVYGVGIFGGRQGLQARTAASAAEGNGGRD